MTNRRSKKQLKEELKILEEMEAAEFYSKSGGRRPTIGLVGNGEIPELFEFGDTHPEHLRTLFPHPATRQEIMEKLQANGENIKPLFVCLADD